MKVVLAYSGGLDSTVLLYWLRKTGVDVKCLSVDYNQRHITELNHGKRITDMLGVEHKIVNLPGVRELLKGSSQTDFNVDVPEGHYAEESMKQTVVPNRNMLLLALCGAWAVSTKSDGVYYAAHAGDHAIYPDCRPEFVVAMGLALDLCDWHKLFLGVPFLGFSKSHIIEMGNGLEVPFGMTWTCYKGGEKHCGKCGSCTERKEAFILAKVSDPTIYQE